MTWQTSPITFAAPRMSLTQLAPDPTKSAFDRVARAVGLGMWGLLGLWLFRQAAIHSGVALERYLDFSPQSFGDHFWGRRYLIVPHIIVGAVAVFAGPVQLIPQLRRRWPSVHRYVGRVYGIACLVSGVFALLLSIVGDGGVSNRLGLAVVSVSWLFSTAYGVLLARRRRFTDHRAWMIRSYALTLSFAISRALAPTMKALGLTTAATESSVMPWVQWIVPVVLTELALRSPYILAKPTRRRAASVEPHRAPRSSQQVTAT